MTRLIAATTAALVLLPAATAAAKAPSTAKIVKKSGAGQVIAYGSTAPEGAPMTGKTLKRHQVYELDGVSATIRMGRTTYKATPGTIVSLNSYAASKGAPQQPALALMVGRLDVSTTRKSPGGVMNEEGLFNPISPLKMRYRVSRTLNDPAEIGPGDVLAFFANLAGQRAGTTTVSSLDGSTVNVTPYVGSKPGTCRHADKATLKSTSRYGKGTADYDLS
jgi:hypothetical protein